MAGLQRRDRFEKFDGLRQPEYTGENRCIPCTIVNVVIALVLAGLAFVLAIELAVVVLVGSLVAIYVRGYLVPGTPTLTKRYLPDRILALFDKGPLVETHDSTDFEIDPDVESTRDKTDGTQDPAEFETVEKIERQRRNAVDPEAFLLDVEAVEPCEGGEDLCLTDAFATAIETRAESYREGPVDRESIASFFDVDVDDVTAKEREYPAYTVGRRIRKWPADGALVADLATNDALLELTDRWTGVPLEQRLKILQSLRTFHDSCPMCGGPVELSAETVESCCRSAEVFTIHCLECTERLLEFTGEEVGIES